MRNKEKNLKRETRTNFLLMSILILLLLALYFQILKDPKRNVNPSEYFSQQLNITEMSNTTMASL